MGALDLSGLTVPIFAVIWGMGWASCYAILVLPTKDRLKQAELKQAEIERQNAAELAELRRRLMK